MPNRLLGLLAEPMANLGKAAQHFDESVAISSEHLIMRHGQPANASRTV